MQVSARRGFERGGGSKECAGNEKPLDRRMHTSCATTNHNIPSIGAASGANPTVDVHPGLHTLHDARPGHRIYRGPHRMRVRLVGGPGALLGGQGPFVMSSGIMPPDDSETT